MKKRYLLMGLLAGALALGTTACAGEANPTNTAPSQTEKTEAPVVLSSIKAENAPTLFRVGDTFKSDGLKVSATMSDGTVVDVTSKAAVSQAPDMSKAGEYDVKVTYEGKECSYKISVLNPNALTLDTKDVKVSYFRGDKLDTTNLKGTLSYDKNLESQPADIAKAVFEIKLGDKVDNELAYEGKHTVNVKVGEAIASYDIDVLVEKVAADATLEDLIDIVEKYSYIPTGGTYSNNPETTYSYAKKGDVLKVSIEDTYYDELGGSFPAVINSYFTVYNKKDVAYKVINAKDDGRELAFQGESGSNKGVKNVDILTYSNPVYGPEDALRQILSFYDDPLAVKKEFLKNGEADANGLHESYTLKFGIAINDGYSDEYREMQIDFKLNSSLFVEVFNAKVDAYPSLAPDDNGVYTPINDPDYSFIVNYTQDAGERELALPYQIEDLIVNDYKMMNGDEEIADNAELNLNLNDSVTIDFKNLEPATAKMVFDNPKFYVESDDPLIPDSTPKNDLFFISDTAQLSITAYSAGTEIITIETMNAKKHIKLNVTAPAPTGFIVQNYVYDEELGFGYLDDLPEVVYLPLGETLKLHAAVEYGADGSYTVALKEAYEGVTLAEGKINYLGNELLSHTFSATAVGDYVVTFTSLKDPSVSTSITVKYGQEKPVLVELPAEIQGVYESDYGDVIITANSASFMSNEQALTAHIPGESFECGTFKFTINADGTLTLDDGMGEPLVITKAPALDVEPLPDSLIGEWDSLYGTVTLTATSAQMGDINANLTAHTPGVSFECGELKFTINADGTLTLDDGMGDPYELTKIEENPVLSEIPAEYAGTYVNAKNPEDTIVVTTTSITINGTTSTFDSVGSEGEVVYVLISNTLGDTYIDFTKDSEGISFFYLNQLYELQPAA